MEYMYKGRKYHFFKEVRMKDPTSRQWINAMCYMDESGNLYVREKKDFHEKFEEKIVIPYHVKAMGKLIAVIKSDDGTNLADGRIEKFHYVESCRNQHKFGQRVVGMKTIDNYHYDAIWAHIANDYYKLIGLWPEIRC